MNRIQEVATTFEPALLERLQEENGLGCEVEEEEFSLEATVRKLEILRQEKL